MSKYYVFNFNKKRIAFSLVIGVIVGLVFSLPEFLNTLSSIVAALISAVIADIGYACYFNNKKIKGLANEISKEFSTLIDRILSISEEKDIEQKKKKIQDQRYYLQINNQHTAETLKFNPNNDSINLLHTAYSTISITAASPSEWLNPTYNFFLINNYISILKHKINNCKTLKILKISDNRDTDVFRDLKRRKKEILEEISALSDISNMALQNYLVDPNRKESIRFYLLSQEDILYHQSILETLLAGHELFGCFIYFVVEDKIPKNTKINEFLKKIDYDLEANNNKTDLMLAGDSDKVTVIYRKKDQLTKKKLDNLAMGEVADYLRTLSKHLLEHYQDRNYISNCDDIFPNDNFKKNEKFTHVFMG